MKARGILSYFVRHRTLANLVMVLMMVAGLVAVLNIRAQYFPDVVLAEVDVDVTWPGAGAEDVDRAIVQVIEPALMGVEGVAATYSRSFEGRASIELEFEPGVNLDRAAQDVQAVVEALSTLPEDAEDPEGEEHGTDREVVGKTDFHNIRSLTSCSAQTPWPGLTLTTLTAVSGVRATWAEMSWRLMLVRWRSVSTIAPIIATSRIIPAASNRNRYLL